MPVYTCPKCGRTVEKPLGYYYCRVCGPSALMVKIGNPNSAEVEVSEGFPEDIKRVVRSFIDWFKRHHRFSVEVHTGRTSMTVLVDYKALADDMKSLLPKSGFYPHIEEWLFTVFADAAYADISLVYKPPFFEIKGNIPVMLATAEKAPIDFAEAIPTWQFPHIKFNLIRYGNYYGLYRVSICISGSERAQPSDVMTLLEEVRNLILMAEDISLNMLRPETVWAATSKTISPNDEGQKMDEKYHLYAIQAILEEFKKPKRQRMLSDEELEKMLQIELEALKSMTKQT